ncbi:hypothetical protein XO10_00465 [Marinitoga sp. 1135]|nr:DUF3467 domain-containing protein [Marinitoga sp. 1135]NUU94795.1 hypothetical protein [Marinitoga sp. 1135]
MEERKVKIIKSEDFKEVYSNFITVSSSFYDLSISFGKIRNASEKGIEAIVREEIIMSPQHAKEFLKILSQHIKKYEEQFGEIKLPGSKEG